MCAFIIGSALVHAQTPADALAQAQEKLKEHDLRGAYEVIQNAAAQKPESAELSCAMGRIDYLRGEFANAEMEFKKALRLDDKLAPAWAGLGKVLEAASLREKARVCYRKAYHDDPRNPEAQRYYAYTLTAAEKLSVLEAYLAQTAGRDDPEVVDAIRRQIEALKWAGSRALFTLTSPPEHTEVKLSYLMMDSKVIRGFALPVSFNGGKTMRLIGDVSFNNCPIGVSDKKFLADEDGLIGTDIFSMFLVTIDIQKMVLKLDPLPKHKTTAADPNWQDREAAPEFSSYTSFWRVGHTILLSTRVSGARPVLFVIDTGSSSSLIDPKYARQLTGVRSEDLVNVKGVSGKGKR